MALPVYTGDANLGVGSGVGAGGANVSDFDSSVKAYNNAFAATGQANSDRFKLLGDTEKTIALLDQENSVRMFQQKVKDRDAAYQSFLEGNAKVDGYLPEDSEFLKSARDKYNLAYDDWAKNINDRDKTKAFKEASDNLHDAAATIATRYKSKQEQEVDIANTTDPELKKQKQANLDYWVKLKDKDGKAALPRIYQRFENYDPERGNKQLKLVSKVVTVDENGKPDPNGVRKVTITYPDAKGTVDGLSELEKSGGAGWTEPEYNFHYLSTLSPELQKSQLDLINDGTDPIKHPEFGMAGKLEALPDGNIVLNTNGVITPISKPELQARFLISKYGYKTSQPEVDDALLKVKTQKDANAVAIEKNAIDKEKNAIAWSKVGIEKDKAAAQIKAWNAKTEGDPKQKSAALSYASNIYKQIQSLADKNGIITPDKARKLTAEQMKYLGFYKDSEVSDTKSGKVVKEKGLVPLTLGGNDIIQIKDGVIRVMRDAKFDKPANAWISKVTTSEDGKTKGGWDRTATTTIANIATNRVNEENQLSAGKEINGYIGIDEFDPNFDSENVDPSEDNDVSNWTKEGDNWRYKDGTLYNSKGEVIKK